MVTRERLRRASLWLLVGTFSMVIFGVGGEFFIHVADDKGWYRNAGQRWDNAMTAVFWFLNSGWVLYPTVFSVGLFLGLRLEGYFFRKEGARIDGQGVKLDNLGQHLDQTLQTLGHAVGSEMALAYDLAVSQSETVLMGLAKWNGFAVPDLRANGSETGVLRALAYLNYLMAPLRLDDELEARKRAAEIVPTLNAKTADQLRSDLKLPRVFGSLPSPPNGTLKVDPAPMPPTQSEFNYPYKKAVLVAGFPTPTGSRDEAGMVEMHCAISVENRHGKTLRNCSVRVISLAARGVALPVDEDLRIGKLGRFDVLSNMPMRATFIRRDLKDRISKPPFLLRLLSHDLPLDDNTQYIMTLELRSEYEYPTNVAVQVDVFEIGGISVTLLDQSV